MRPLEISLFGSTPVGTAPKFSMKQLDFLLFVSFYSQFLPNVRRKFKTSEHCFLPFETIRFRPFSSSFLVRDLHDCVFRHLRGARLLRVATGRTVMLLPWLHLLRKIEHWHYTCIIFFVNSYQQIGSIFMHKPRKCDI